VEALDTGARASRLGPVAIDFAGDDPDTGVTGDEPVAAGATEDKPAGPDVTADDAVTAGGGSTSRTPPIPRGVVGTLSVLAAAIGLAAAEAAGATDAGAGCRATVVARRGAGPSMIRAVRGSTCARRATRLGAGARATAAGASALKGGATG
jgi:hypothetical protein